ncbi:hypothetical protein DXG01_007311 [Tephrocybe rancida]|nr:hypothetical protein DXG01_007311 [Tephrocybe rancida]
MGHSSLAIFSYGIVLGIPQIKRLLAVVGASKGPRTADSKIDGLLEDMAPYRFQAGNTYDDDWPYSKDDDSDRASDSDESESDEGAGYNAIGDTELIISFDGLVNDKRSHQPGVEIRGYSASGVSYTKVDLPNDKKFLEDAKNAFQKLKDSKAFQDAKITEDSDFVPPPSLSLDTDIFVFDSAPEMGRCSKATFSYGIVLSKPQIKRLLKAIEVDSEPGEAAFCLYGWLGSKDLAPYCYSADNTYDPEWAEDDGDSDSDGKGEKPSGTELMIFFDGLDDDEKEEASVEAWGYNPSCTKYTEVPMLNDNKFIKDAKKAFHKLKETKGFQEAQITEVVPRWLLRLNIDG